MLLAGWKHQKDQDVYEKPEFKSLLTYFGTSTLPSVEKLVGCAGDKFKSKWENMVINFNHILLIINTHTNKILKLFLFKYLNVFRRN